MKLAMSRNDAVSIATTLCAKDRNKNEKILNANSRCFDQLALVKNFTLSLSSKLA